MTKGGVIAGDVSLPYSELTGDDYKALAENQFVIDRLWLRSNPPKFVLDFRRGVSSSATDLDPRAPSSFFDDVGVETVNDPNGAKAATIVESAEFLSFVQKRLVEAPLYDPEKDGASQVLNTQFSQMNQLLSEVTERVHARQVELDEQHRQRVNALEAEYKDLRASLDLQQERRISELDARADKLTAQEEAIDNRQHMHARRDLRDKITSEIQQRLAGTLVHRQSFWIRYGVLALMVAAGLGLGGLSFFSLAEYTSIVRQSTSIAAGVTSELAADIRLAKDMVTTGSVWYLLGRAALSAFGAVAFLLYAISWLKRVYAEDVRAQRDLERYSIDLSRASWAIETIMEAKSNGDVAIPDILVAGVAKNLFDASAKSEADGNDALASFLKASIRGKITPNGAEFDFNNRGTTKLAKEVEAGN